MPKLRIEITNNKCSINCCLKKNNKDSVDSAEVENENTDSIVGKNIKCWGKIFTCIKPCQKKM